MAEPGRVRGCPKIKQDGTVCGEDRRVDWGYAMELAPSAAMVKSWALCRKCQHRWQWRGPRDVEPTEVMSDK